MWADVVITNNTGKTWDCHKTVLAGGSSTLRTAAVCSAIGATWDRGKQLTRQQDFDKIETYNVGDWDSTVIDAVVQWLYKAKYTRPEAYDGEDDKKYNRLSYLLELYMAAEYFDIQGMA